MGDVWLKIKLWTKGIFFSALLIYVLLFVANNSRVSVGLWFWFKHTPETSVLLLVLYAFLTGVVCTILIGTTFRTVGQVRDLRQRSRTDRLERDMNDMRTKAAMLRSKSTGPVLSESSAPPPRHRTPPHQESINTAST